MGMTDRKFAKVLYHLVWEEKRLRQAEIVKKTGLPQSTVSAIMNGNRGSDLERRMLIADCFGMSVDEFLSYLDKDKVSAGSQEKCDLTENGITEIHQEIVTKFKYKDKGLAASKALLEIEKLDPDGFFKLVSDIERIALKLQLDAEKDGTEDDLGKAVNQD